MGFFLSTELFKKEQIDLKTFASMDDHGLQQKGIGSSTVRKRMLKAMKGTFYFKIVSWFETDLYMFCFS